MLPTGPGADYCRAMNLAQRVVSACLVALALLGAAASATAADEGGLSVTERIFRDYALDRVIDDHYSAADLSAALDLAQDDAAFSEFASAVQETYDRDILGLSTDPDPQPLPIAGTADEPDSLALPRPQPPGARDQPPWPFLALTALAGMLVLTGAGSSLLRRSRR